jgi:hypothetical protein
MKKQSISLVLTLALALFVLVAPAAAQTTGAPVGACPVGFELHEAHMHMGDHEHHVGLTVDLNGSGFICVKHLTSGFHVHMDDVVKP